MSIVEENMHHGLEAHMRFSVGLSKFNSFQIFSVVAQQSVLVCLLHFCSGLNILSLQVSHRNILSLSL